MLGKIKTYILANIKSMKKFRIVFILFFIFVFCHAQEQKPHGFAYENSYSYEFVCDGKKYYFKNDDFNLNLSSIQKENYHNIDLINKLEKLNLTDEEILNYLFPEIKLIFQKLSKIFNKSEKQDEIIVKQNKCILEYISGDMGKCIDKKSFFGDCLNQIKDGCKSIKINIKIMDYKHGKSARELFTEKSCFSTNFETSSNERKNNIRLALSMLDGLIIDEGEIFSFNEITGQRNQDTGYQPAKIISQGTFVIGYGGGVCQVSTTLYNACLLSGLEIVESSSHSLPVSYIEPSFDAMVNTGSSDLKIRNNSGGKIIITTSSDNDICKIKIFGLKNKYKITRHSEKLSIIPAEQDVIETDYNKYNYDLQMGEEIRLSYPKDGFISRAYLNFYDEKGNLIERKLIRENKYNATRGVILKREK